MRVVGRCRPPDAWRWWVQRRCRPAATVVQPRGEHCPGCRFTDNDSRSPRSGRVVGQARYVRVVDRLQRWLLRWEQAGKISKAYEYTERSRRSGSFFRVRLI